MITIVIGFVIPFLFNWKENLKWSLDIIRTISIVSASILALFYFDPFGIRKANLEKQHDNVILILEKTFTQRILADVESSKPNAPKMFAQHFMTIKNLKYIFKDNSKIEYLNYPVFINVENFVEQTMELTELKNSLFTPKSISEKMTFLEFSIATNTKKKHENYLILTWGGGKNKDFEKLYDMVNNKELTLKEILKNYEELINECLLWLETNSFSTKQLNIK